jgi:prophage antirepressor-like protein
MELTNFDFNSNNIRVVQIDGEPWFLAKECAEILGFKTTAGAGWYTRHLNSNELNTITLTEGKRGNPRKTIISESGLYKLIMRSDKREARVFQDWVTGTVLPAIRKDGGYIAGEDKVAKGGMSEDELILKATT